MVSDDLRLIWGASGADDHVFLVELLELEDWLVSYSGAFYFVLTEAYSE